MSKDDSPNRDINRQNKASTLVSANMYSNITKEGIQVCLSILDNSFSNELSPQLIATKSILTKVEKSNEIAKKKFCRCSTHVKCGAISIAHKEIMMIKSSIKNCETKMLKSNLRHYNEDVVEMHRFISHAEKQSSFHKDHPITQSTHPLSTLDTNDMSLSPCHSNDSEDNDFMSFTTDSFNTSLQQEIDVNTVPVITKDTIPHVPNTIKPTTRSKIRRPSLISILPFFFLPVPNLGEVMYTPIQAINIVTNNSDNSKRRILHLPKVNGKLVVRRLSKFGIITMMIEKTYIPISKTQMYALLKKSENDMKGIPNWWTNSSKRGSKPHLLPSTLNDLTKKFHDSTDGGTAISKKELKEII